jgi:hypothetical protein
MNYETTNFITLSIALSKLIFRNINQSALANGHDYMFVLTYLS